MKKHSLIWKINLGLVTWNAIMKTLSALKKGFKFRLGGENSSFWITNWSRGWEISGAGSLCGYVQSWNASELCLFGWELELQSIIY